jgi:hypothetical protein
MPNEIQDRLVHTIDATFDNILKPIVAIVKRETTAPLAATQAAATDLIVKRVLESAQVTTIAVQNQTLESRAQNSSLQMKVDEVNARIKSLGASIAGFPPTRNFSSNSELQSAVDNIISSVWQFLWNVQRLVHELVYVSFHAIDYGHELTKPQIAAHTVPCDILPYYGTGSLALRRAFLV